MEASSNANAAENPIKTKIPHISRSAVTNGREKKFRRGSAQRGNQEEHGGHDQSALAANAGLTNRQQVRRRCSR